jgi:hypothetical protein
MQEVMFISGETVKIERNIGAGCICYFDPGICSKISGGSDTELLLNLHQFFFS